METVKKTSTNIDDSSRATQVYFDGACHLCSREIEMYREKDREKKLELIDISQSDFDAKKEGLDPVEVNRQFHVRTKNGQVLTGVGAFAVIWEELGIFKPLSWLSQRRLSRQVMDLGYWGFAKVRPLLPKKENCDNGQCRV